MKKVVLTILGLFFYSMISLGQDLPGNLPWVPNWNAGSNTMSVFGVVMIDGVEQRSETLVLAAFCTSDGECRDAQLPFYDDFDDRWYYIAAPSGEAGDVFTFKLFDSSGSGTILDLDCKFTLEFTEEPMGFDEPFEFTFETLAPAPYTLDITGYGSNPGGYYLIASPVASVTPSTENGFLTEAYDLYEFDQSADNEWVNYEQHGFDIVSGKGYLYASQASTTLTFEGQPYNGNGKIDLVYDENANLAGWNLIGNPFGVTASIGRDFYVMNPAGSEIVLAETDQIEAMQGVFVIAEHDGETVTFTPGASTDDGNKLVINVAQNRSSVIDRAIVRFGQGNQLPKFMLNDNNTKLYIPQADNDYAVVRSDDEAELPLNFKAAANGTYILKVDANSTELDYLHLIDNKTGNDIDLLENPSYTFEANATDFANRFKLVLRNTTSIDENTNFAFYNGLDWTVNNEGKSTLQVVDMTGRIVSTETIDGTAHVTINAAPGAYMLQLTNGNDVKTQKIIIK